MILRRRKSDAEPLATEGNSPTAATEAAEAEPEGSTAPKRAGIRGHRLVWLVAGIAVLSLAAGVGLSTVIKSPAEQAAAAAPPDADVVTAPVERRVLSNDVTVRADATFEDSVEVKIPATADAGGAPAIITGHVPEVGTELNPADVALEVSGRPVIVLAGDLPAFRTIGNGSTGPDVTQLRAALRALGIDPGKGKDDVYDASVAAGVQKLYTKVGYPAPTAGAEADAAVKTAQTTVTTAQQELDKANAALTAGPENQPTDALKLEADNNVKRAQRTLTEAQANGGDVADAQDALSLAQAQRAEMDKPADRTALTQMVDTAKAALKTARDDLTEAQAKALTPLPVGEILYLANTPRRVDAVNVKRGDPVPTTAAMSVSGATMTLDGSIAESDAKLLAAGAKGTATLPDDSELGVTVTAVEPKKSDAGGGGGDAGSGGGGEAGKSKDTASSRYTVKLAPDSLTPAQVELLRGQNVRVVIPVNSTGGEVLAVPVAALTAGSGGESRVNVKRGAKTELVVVVPGLAADGFIEITKADGDLAAGDKVVVGK